MSSRVVALHAVGETQEDAVARAREGDEGAQTILFRRHAQHVARVLARLAGGNADLSDLVQDVFLVAFRDLTRLRDDRAFRAWLTGIAVHKARQARRSRARRFWLRFMAPEDVPTVGSEPASPELREALRAAEAALATLAEIERVAFVLRFLEKMQIDEIAAATDVSPATVKRRIAAARAHFLDLARDDPRLRDWVEDES